jgi:DNA-binding NarL/FixJ family response regulator
MAEGISTRAIAEELEVAGDLVGREAERTALKRAVAAAVESSGGLLLLAGEAGVGKTTLARNALAGAELLVLEATATSGLSSPYGPIVAVLRAYLRVVPGGLDGCGPLARYLGVLLPELGAPTERGDRPTLFEAVRCALTTIARRQPTAILLDDLQWADDATLELLPVLAGTIAEEPLLLLGVYRSEEISRAHPLRRMRSDLRRAGRLNELVVEPLAAEETAVLARRVLGRPPSSALATMLFLRTQGIPLFVEELAQALVSSGRLREGRRGLELAGSAELPLPETVRDAILLRVEGLSGAAKEALEVASVAGVRFELGPVADLAPGHGLEEAIEAGFLLEVEVGTGAFRHALAREALYHAVPWRRRRRLHREVAQRLGRAGAPPAAIAEHWFAAGEAERARQAFVAAAVDWCGVHAYRDAARAARRALDLWPEDEDEPGRLDVLERLGECAQLAGDFGEAARAWGEAADGRALAGDARAWAEVERRRAGLYELQCAWDSALAARAAAADGFSASGLPGEAAAERLAAAASLQSGGRLSAALELVTVAAGEADEAGRQDLKVRAMGLEGLVRARLGDPERGLELARAGLSAALDANQPGPAAEVYERLGMILENASDYPRAIVAWTNAFEFCEAHGAAAKAHLCLVCLAYVMRKTGEWDRAIGLCRDVLAAEDPPRAARCAAIGLPGLIHVLRGDVRRARTPLGESFALAQRIDFMIMRIESAWGLARLDALEAEHDSAAERCRQLLELAVGGEDSHYPVAALRWAASLFASRGAVGEAGRCAEILARVASLSGNAEALAALAHTLGEIALLEGDAEHAATQFTQALEFFRDLELPLDLGETQLRAGVALVAAGERESGLERITDAYHIGRKLGARPLATQAVEALARLGEQIDQRLGRRARAALEQGGLSRREREILRLVAAGGTNREIARQLFLSTRTVDMHVRNILRKLDCRSRAEATRKAAELGLLL